MCAVLLVKVVKTAYQQWPFALFHQDLYMFGGL